MTASLREVAGRLPRPSRAAAPVAGSVLALGAWAAVAHNSGSGWVQALGALLAGCLTVGLLAPALAVWRVRITALEAPLDAVAGVQAAVLVKTTALVEVRAFAPHGPTSMVPGGSPRELAFLPTRHGELGAIRVRLGSAAPFGLLWWHKDVLLRLPRPVLVAPRVGQPDARLLADQRSVEGAVKPVPARVGEPRGVREYRPGDPRHWVHWPATAHAGTLMVRETEQLVGSPPIVRADLCGDADQAERIAEVIMGTIDHLLLRGRSVVLVTFDANEARTDEVGSLREAGRLLARAGPAPVPAPPAGPQP